MRKEKTSKFYTGKGYLKEGTFELYKSLYKDIISLLPEPNVCSRIVDLGCGVGYFAKILYEMGYVKYVGIDFSQDMLNHAKKNAPYYDYFLLSLYDEEIEEFLSEYDLFTIIETLEHIENDCQVLEKLPIGSMIIGSVPSSFSSGHVRVFKGISEVVRRYDNIIKFDFLETRPSIKLNKEIITIFRGIIK